MTNHRFYKNLQTTISKKWKNIKAAGFFGLWKPCGKQEIIDQWRVALPQIDNHIFQYEEIGHFIEEYKGREIAQNILEFLKN